MAIKIPILTSFNPKGLKQANAAFAGLQTSLGSLGRNFAVLGAGITGATALLGKAVTSASNFEAEFEGVNQVFKEAAGSVQAFAKSAAETAGLSATEALSAAKTFGLFATGAGMGVKEAASFSTTMVQLAGDLGSFNDLPTADALAAIQSGLQGQSEPLRNFGVFLDDANIKQALFNATGEKVTGTLTSQQKMIGAYNAILQQTTTQQGDFVNYQETLGNQLKIVSAEFSNLSTDIGLMLIPAITAAMPAIREMALEIGDNLKTAIGSIDWPALVKSIADLAIFFVQNFDAISKTVGVLFALSTIFKTLSVIIMTAKVGMALYTAALAVMTIAKGGATVASTALAVAMNLIPFVAIATAIGLVTVGLLGAADAANKASGAIAKVPNVRLEADTRNRQANDYTSFLGRRAAEGRGEVTAQPLAPSFAGASGAASAASAEISQAARDAEEAQRQAAAREKEILDRRQAAFKSFQDSVKGLFSQIKDSIMSAFSLPDLGNSVNSIT